MATEKSAVKVADTILTWQERVMAVIDGDQATKQWWASTMTSLGWKAMAEEIADLRAALASRSQPQGEPVANVNEPGKVAEITERIRLSSGTHTGKGKIQLHYEVEHLLGHIALLKSASPVAQPVTPLQAPDQAQEPTGDK